MYQLARFLVDKVGSWRPGLNCFADVLNCFADDVGRKIPSLCEVWSYPSPVVFYSLIRDGLTMTKKKERDNFHIIVIILTRLLHPRKLLIYDIRVSAYLNYIVGKGYFSPLHWYSSSQDLNFPKPGSIISFSFSSHHSCSSVHLCSVSWTAFHWSLRSIRIRTLSFITYNDASKYNT